MENLTLLAQRGSVKAIMQILNRQLRDAGVSTKVTPGAQGTLEILCEAEHPENLDKQSIVRSIQMSLDHLSPRPFEQVHIKSALTNNVQVSWVARLSQGDRQKLLWSEHIQIHHLSWLQRQLQQWGIKPQAAQAPGNGLPPGKPKSKKQFTRLYSPGLTLEQKLWLISGAIAATALGWFIHDWWQLKQLTVSPPTTPPLPTLGLSPAPNEDAFNQAVRLANQAVQGGLEADTYGEWLDLANRWQRASSLMALVPVEHPRYGEAQERVLSYRQNSALALAKAEALASEAPP